MGLGAHSVFNNYQEIYDAVLDLTVTGNKQGGILIFDEVANVHGDATYPITTNLLIDPANAIEGATVEVVWQGSVNPNITGVPAADILNIGENITSQGIYSIFIIYTGGKYKVNIQSSVAYVGNGGALDPPSGNQRAIITLLGIDPVEVIEGNSYADAGATAFDIEDGNITADIVTVNPVNVNIIGSYTVTYNVVDSLGLAALEVTRIVNVVSDETSPIITVTDPVGVETNPVITVTDAIETSPVITVT